MNDITKQHHNEQFMEYYERYADDIFRFCMVKTRDRQRSLDITQDTFTKLWEYIIKDTVFEHERALLYRIANNLIIDHYRKKKDILVEDFSETPYFQELSENPQERMENKIDGEYAIILLQKLPENLREIVTMRFINGFSISEIAQSIGKDPKTVSVYLHRGIKQLRTLLDQYE